MIFRPRISARYLAASASVFITWSEGSVGAASNGAALEGEASGGSASEAVACDPVVSAERMTLDAAAAALVAKNRLAENVRSELRARIVRQVHVPAVTSVRLLQIGFTPRE